MSQRTSKKKKEELSPLALAVLGECRTVSLILIVFNKVGPHFTRPALEARQSQRKGTRSSLKWCNEQSWMCGNHFLWNVTIFAICHTSKSKLNQSKKNIFRARVKPCVYNVCKKKKTLNSAVFFLHAIFKQDLTKIYCGSWMPLLFCINTKPINNNTISKY